MHIKSWKRLNFGVLHLLCFVCWLGDDVPEAKDIDEDVKLCYGRAW